MVTQTAKTKPSAIYPRRQPYEYKRALIAELTAELERVSNERDYYRSRTAEHQRLGNDPFLGVGIKTPGGMRS